mmetsp:Transcript_14348/g.21884  ORF Transcript_14348/g.21884 Transcript_14348/m.21884 type:complete len:90 (-) Transcript_14348:620-889(-)
MSKVYAKVERICLFFDLDKVFGVYHSAQPLVLYDTLGSEVMTQRSKNEDFAGEKDDVSFMTEVDDEEDHLSSEMTQKPLTLLRISVNKE